MKKTEENIKISIEECIRSAAAELCKETGTLPIELPAALVRFEERSGERILSTAAAIRLTYAIENISESASPLRLHLWSKRLADATAHHIANKAEIKRYISDIESTVNGYIKFGLTPEWYADIVQIFICKYKAVSIDEKEKILHTENKISNQSYNDRNFNIRYAYERAERIIRTAAMEITDINSEMPQSECGGALQRCNERIIRLLEEKQPAAVIYAIAGYAFESSNRSNMQKNADSVAGQYHQYYMSSKNTDPVLSTAVAAVMCEACGGTAGGYLNESGSTK